jgi:CRISPR/Cas system-associated exonuclease Cas4 (RecB family)
MPTISRTTTPIKATSYSRFKKFRTCQKQAFLAYVLRKPESERPKLPEGKEYPNDRGSRVHYELEAFVNAGGKFSREALAFSEEIHHLRALKQNYPQRVITEEVWCFDRNWRQVLKDDFKQIWLRVILDVIVFISEKEAIVIDYKSGQRMGNEIDHARQVQLYQLVAFLLFPNLKIVHTELWYLDQDEIASMTFTRLQGRRFFEGFDDGFKEMTNTLIFKSNPNSFSCRFCPYKTGTISKKQGTEGTGDCDENP